MSRENGARRIVVETNVRGRDIQGVAQDIQKVIDAELVLPTGYYVEYGGTFKNLEEASARLMLTVPLALALIFVLLFFAFRSITEALIIFSAVPLASITWKTAIMMCSVAEANARNTIRRRLPEAA